MVWCPTSRHATLHAQLLPPHKESVSRAPQTPCFPAGRRATPSSALPARITTYGHMFAPPGLPKKPPAGAPQTYAVLAPYTFENPLTAIW